MRRSRPCSATPPRGTVRHGFRPNRFFDVEARRAARAAPASLVQELESGIGDRRHPWPRFPLAETVIHGQDIRLALARDRVFPTDRLLVVADTLRRPEYPFLLHKPARGLRLVATDVDWTKGRGPELRGTLHDLVMVMAGRDADHASLEGPGVDALATHR